MLAAYTGTQDCSLLFEAAFQIAALRQEIAIWRNGALTWQDRYESERRDHEATMKDCDAHHFDRRGYD